jgi:hypothetical protein
MKYLPVNVYKEASRINQDVDCTNGGVSSKFKTLFVPCEEGNYTKEQILEHEGPEVILKAKNHVKDYICFEPEVKPEGVLSSMFGGNFIYSSDSRFRRISAYPAPLHDRFETPEEYKTYST